MPSVRDISTLNIMYKVAAQSKIMTKTYLVFRFARPSWNTFVSQVVRPSAPKIQISSTANINHSKIMSDHSSKLNLPNYEQVKSSPVLKVYSHEGSNLYPKMAQLG